MRLCLSKSIVTPAVAHAAPKTGSLAARHPAEGAVSGEHAAVDYTAVRLRS